LFGDRRGFKPAQLKKKRDLNKVFSNLEPEGQGRGIIMEVTHILLLGPFYTIQTNFMYIFAHDRTGQIYDTSSIKAQLNFFHF
jgi:hypothetical protein